MNEKRLLEIQARKAEILSELPDATTERCAELNAEADELIKEETAIRAKTNLADKLGQVVPTPTNANKERAKRFMECRRAQFQTRSLLLSGGKIAQPTEVSGINGLYETQVSSLIDLIKVTDCTGMGTYRVAYQKDGIAAAGAKTEGTAPTEADVTDMFAYVDLTPTMYATLAYVSKDIRRQSPLDYEVKVVAAVRDALRKKASEVAVTNILASTLNQSLDVTTIDKDTLENIVLGYGGDEGIEGAAYLFLNKKDLLAFGAVKGKNEYLPVYTIVPDTLNPNTGTIKVNNGLSCRYCLNKNIKALTGTTASASAATKTMFYGNPQTAEMALFGDTTVEDSDGYKFAEGLITIRGETSADIDVTTWHGFTVVNLPKTGG